jgi:hypothetical protein
MEDPGDGVLKIPRLADAHLSKASGQQTVTKRAGSRYGTETGNTKKWDKLNSENNSTDNAPITPLQRVRAKLLQDNTS